MCKTMLLDCGTANASQAKLTLSKLGRTAIIYTSADWDATRQLSLRTESNVASRILVVSQTRLLTSVAAAAGDGLK